MKAGVASENGLVLRQIPQNEVLVNVRVPALNRADLTTARGLPHGSHGSHGEVGAPVGLECTGFDRFSDCDSHFLFDYRTRL